MERKDFTAQYDRNSLCGLVSVNPVCNLGHMSIALFALISVRIDDRYLESADKMLKLLLRSAFLLGLVMNISMASADDVLIYLVDTDDGYSGPTVEDNVAAMDTDKNGFADVTEVRAFLALKNGSEYEKEILDRWQLRSQGKSCTLPPDDKLFNQTNAIN